MAETALKVRLLETQSIQCGFIFILASRFNAATIHSSVYYTGAVLHLKLVNFITHFSAALVSPVTIGS